MSRQKLRDQRNGLLFISPWVIGFFVFTFFPMLQALYYSFTEYGGLVSKPKWIGLDNYVRMFTKDNLFGTVTYNTLYMVLIGGIFITLFTLAISILLNDKRLRGVSGFRVMFFLPTLVPSIILCILWTWLFNPDSGMINNILSWFHITGPAWLSSVLWSKPALLIMRLWCSGNLIIIFLGGLQDIPPDLYEAVEIDGGNFWHKTLNVTLPLMKPVILFNVINTLINVMQMFTEPLVMTNAGGPNNTTYTYALYIYKSAFQYSKMGYASALSWIMLIVSMVLTFIALRAGGYFEKD
jgi:ABC-type sugar transport systems, permease components